MTSHLRTGLPWLFAFACLGAGCDQLSDFRTGDRAIYTGEVVGSDSEEGQPSFIRQGFESHTRIDLTFDPALASVSPEPGAVLAPAGSIDTYLCRQQAQPCPEGERVPGHFRKAALDPVPNLAHDALSEYDFPGGGRVRNYILVSRFALAAEPEAAQGAAMVFLSLMDNGSVEARVIAPHVAAAQGGVEQPALFGVFVLERRAL